MQHYVLRFHTYSGMHYEVDCGDDLKEIRSAAAKFIMNARRTQPVGIVKPGHSWEFVTPDDAFMISDNDGTLHLLEYEQPDEDFGDDDLDIEEFNAAYILDDEHEGHAA
jgi:hypothetical protein